MEELAASVTCGRMASQPTASGLSATHACCLAGATGRGLGRPARAPLALGVHTRVETLKKNKVTVGMKFRTSMASGVAGGLRAAMAHKSVPQGGRGGGSRKAPFILSLRSLRFRLLGPGFGLTCVEVRAGPPAGFAPSTGPSHAPFSGSSCSHLPSQRELSVDLRDPESRSRCHFLGLAVPPQSER